MNVLLYTFFSCIIILSCKPTTPGDTTSGNSASDELKALEIQVMAVHDEVMPKMADITKINAQLRAIKATAKESPIGKLEVPDGLEEVMASLKLAEQGMWDWMKSYSDTKATLNEDQLKSFYEKELETINKVKLDMLSSIEKAQAWLAAHPNQ